MNPHLSIATSVVDHPTMVSGDRRLFVPDTTGAVAASVRNPRVTGRGTSV